MKPLLFVGAEYFRRLADSNTPREEHDALSEDLARYCQSEVGTAALIIEAFCSALNEEAETISPTLWLWFLDWAPVAYADWQEDITPEFLLRLWNAHTHDDLRLRVLELLAELEETSDKPVDSSPFLRLLKKGQQGSSNVTSSEPQEDVLAVTDVFDFLLAEGNYDGINERPLNILGSFMRSLDQKSNAYIVFESHVMSRIRELENDARMRTMLLVINRRS